MSSQPTGETGPIVVSDDEMASSLGALEIQENLDFFGKEKFKGAYLYMSRYSQNVGTDGYSRSEHHVARFFCLILFKIFLEKDWVPVPQYYTLSGMTPDWVFETFEFQQDPSDGANSYLFVPRLWIDFKVQDPEKPAIPQLEQSVSYNQAKYLSSKGYLVGIEGFEVSGVDFQHVLPQSKPDDSQDFERITHHFYENPYNMGSQGRPIPSKEYKGKTAKMDIRDPNQFQDILHMLEYMAKNPVSRDFVPHKRGVKRLPESLTLSLFPGYVPEEEEDLPRFASHLAEYF